MNSPRSRIASLIGSLFVLTFSGGAAAADEFHAGNWKTRVLMSPDGNDYTDYLSRSDCVTPERARASAADRLAALASQLTAAECAVTRSRLDAGHIEASLSCKQAASADQTPASVEASGTYTADSFDILFVATHLADPDGSGHVVPKLYLRQQSQRTGGC